MRYYEQYKKCIKESIKRFDNTEKLINTILIDVDDMLAYNEITPEESNKIEMLLCRYAQMKGYQTIYSDMENH